MRPFIERSGQLWISLVEVRVGIHFDAANAALQLDSPEERAPHDQKVGELLHPAHGLKGRVPRTAGPGLTNTIAALKNAQLAQSPVLLIGGAAPTALQGRGALQDIDQKPLVAPHVKLIRQVRRVADLGPAISDALAAARTGVPGPVFVECPVDLLYEEATIRQWYDEAAGKGTSVADRLLRWYLHRHAAKLFAGSGEAMTPEPRLVPAPTAGRGALKRAVDARARAERPLMVIGSQALAEATNADALAAAVARMGVPVYLSGMARGLLGRDHPLQMRHERRKALRESDCVLLAGVPCDFRLDYGKHVKRSATLIAVNRSARGPVTSSRSAWRGLATRCTAKRSRSYRGFPVAAISASHPLQLPASTWRT